MVELTELTEDSTVNQTSGAQPIVEDPAVDSLGAVEESDDEEFSSDDEDIYEDETFYERLVALKDIIPPKKRKTISSFYSGTVSLFRTVFSKGGNVMWALTTSALLLGVPLSLSILAEQQLIEMEKSFDLQKDANDILASGEAAAPVAPAPAI